MGTISDRFANRKTPLNALATRIVRAASASAFQEDAKSFEAIQALMCEALRAHEPTEFEELLTLVHAEAQLRCDAEDVVDEVQYFAETTCSEIYGESGAIVGRMLAIPLMVTDKRLGWAMPLTPDVCEQLTAVFKEGGIIVPEAQVTYAPRMLLPVEAQHMQYGTLNRIMLAMAAGEMDKVQELLEAQKLRMDIGVAFAEGDPGSDALLGSIAVLAAYVATRDLEPFPLAMELRNALPAAQDLPDPLADEAVVAAQTAEVAREVAEVLDGISKQLAQALGASGARLNSLTEDWFDGVASACRLEREVAAMQLIRQTARAHTDGVVTDLCATQRVDADAEDAWTVVQLHHKYTKRLLADVPWKTLAGESPEDSELALGALLDSVKLTAPVEHSVVTAINFSKPKTVS